MDDVMRTQDVAAATVAPATRVLSFADLPDLELGPVAPQQPQKRTRREALKLGAGAAAAAVAMTTFNVLRSPVTAGASGPGMDRYPTRNPYGSGLGSGCYSDTGCTGTSADLIDSSFCSTCSDYTANHNNWIGFMFTGGRNGNSVLDDYPGQFCAGPYDYWVHTGTPCGYCPYDVAYRCHDGIKWTSSSSSDFVICHSVAVCNGNGQSTSC